MIGERPNWELDGNGQHPGFVNQIQPIVPVISSIATYTMMHEEHGCPGVEITWRGGVQYQRTIRECRIVVGQRGSGLLKEAHQIDHLQHHRLLEPTLGPPTVS